MDALAWTAAHAGALIRLAPAETAHRMTIRALAAGLGPRIAPPDSPRLASTVWDIDFASPIGLAAGFDKNAEAVAGLLGLGPGFIEIGAVTPRPQQGNPKPRVFRLKEDRAIINRLGFNNEGARAAQDRLRAWRRGAQEARDGAPPQDVAPRGIVGANIGANKNSVDRMADYETVLRELWGLADFFTVNVSSPNTEKLRDLQGAAALRALLSRVVAARDGLAGESGVSAPVLVKIAPDLTEAELDAAVDAALEAEVDGLIATNTTTARPATLTAREARQAGGLSGAPLFEASTAALRRAAKRVDGRAPIIGVGGVFTGRDAYAKIRAGASLVQLYTGLVYRGPTVFRVIAEELAALLARDGFGSVAEAIGADL
ncbi:MAG: quinone-dependent dihydroorotate dehydrogenase [Pseudomonadota bacterium]